MRSWYVLAGLLVVAALIGGCPGADPPAEAADGHGGPEPVRIAYVPWDSEIASTHLAAAVIEERLGVPVELVTVPLPALWEAVASGDIDATLAAWLPSLQQEQKAAYGDELEILGPHLVGTRIGLAVPEYVPVDRIGELAEHSEAFDGKIIGIDPGAGIMEQTRAVMALYGLEADFQLVSGSDSTMTTVLGRAIEERRWVVVTAWTPHWMFAQWDLKYLADPRDGFGETERIHTLVREGLAADRPRVYAFLERFSWEVADMEALMLRTQQPDTSPSEAARAWMGQHEEQVARWLEG